MIVKRKCVGCQKIKNVEDLIKITRRNPDSTVVINPDAKTFGRSAYLCYNNNCIESALKNNKIQKALKTSLKEDLKGKLNEFGQYKS